jgi:hypothetical protein
MKASPRTFPVRLLDLCVQIDGRGEVPVQQLGRLETDVLGKRIGRAVHLCSPQSNWAALTDAGKSPIWLHSKVGMDREPEPVNSGKSW